jgi:hypothetical protein
VSNDEICEMLISVMTAVERTHTSQESEIKVLRDKLTRCEEHLSMLVAAIAINPTLRGKLGR